MTENINLLGDFETVNEIFGANDKYLNLIEDELGVKVTFRNGNMKVRGSEDALKKAKEFFFFNN